MRCVSVNGCAVADPPGGMRGQGPVRSDAQVNGMREVLRRGAAQEAHRAGYLVRGQELQDMEDDVERKVPGRGCGGVWAGLGAGMGWQARGCVAVASSKRLSGAERRLALCRGTGWHPAC